MKKNFIKVPFNLDMAKKITSGEMEGRVVTRRGDDARIIHFNAKNKRQIIALVDYGDGEIPEGYTQKGCWDPNGEDEFDCDLMLEIPEMSVTDTFKEGDVLVSNEVNIGLLDKCENGKHVFHVVLWDVHETPNTIYTNAKIRYATEGEKQQLIEALRRDQKEKSCKLLKKYFGIKLQVSKVCSDDYFIPGMAVLGIDHNGKWRFDMFSHIDTEAEDDYRYVCSGRIYKHIIPFYGNNDLAGTDANVTKEESKQRKKRKENNV